MKRANRWDATPLTNEEERKMHRHRMMASVSIWRMLENFARVNTVGCNMAVAECGARKRIDQLAVDN